MATENESFVIEVPINSSSIELHIIVSETTDGIEFYKCYLGEKEITQLREDAGEWKQIWGNLKKEEANKIGSTIADFKKEKLIS